MKLGLICSSFSFRAQYNSLIPYYSSHYFDQGLPSSRYRGMIILLPFPLSFILSFYIEIISLIFLPQGIPTRYSYTILSSNRLMISKFVMFDTPIMIDLTPFYNPIGYINLWSYNLEKFLELTKWGLLV